jgi:lysophospholipase L1-like esterase
VGPQIPPLYLVDAAPLLSTPAVVLGLGSAGVLLLAVCLLERPLVRRTGFPRLVRVGLVVAFFLTWECALRLIVLQFPYATFRPDVWTGWRLNHPPAQLQHAFGLRFNNDAPVALFESEHGMDKPPQVYRILFFGDSQTINVANRMVLLDTYTKVVQRTLSGATTGHSVQALNLGMSGYTTWQGLRLLQKIGLQYHPDLVVFAFANQDSSPSYGPDSETMVDGPWVAQVRETAQDMQMYLLLHRCIRELRLLGGPSPDGEDAFRVPLSDFRQNLRTLVPLGREHGFRAAFLVEPMSPDFGPVHPSFFEYCRSIRRVAAEEHVLLLDVNDAFARLPRTETARLFVDQTHLTRRGHRYFGELVAGWLLQASRTGQLDL